MQQSFGKCAIYSSLFKVLRMQLGKVRTKNHRLCLVLLVRKNANSSSCSIRVGRTDGKANLRRRWSAGWEMEQNTTLYYDEGVFSVSGIAKGDHQLYQLLCKRLGQRLVGNALSNVVVPFTKDKTVISKSTFSIPHCSVIYRWRMPFDWKNPIGYLCAIILQSIAMFYITHIGICHAAFVSGTCLMLITMNCLLKKDLNVVNQMVKNNRHHYELMNVLPKCIDFHSIVKQLSIHLKYWKFPLVNQKN